MPPLLSAVNIKTQLLVTKRVMRQIKVPAPGGGFGSGGRTLIALPIVLASFALILQLSNRQMEEKSSLYFHANGVGALMCATILTYSCSPACSCVGLTDACAPAGCMCTTMQPSLRRSCTANTLVERLCCTVGRTCGSSFTQGLLCSHTLLASSSVQ